MASEFRPEGSHIFIRRDEGGGKQARLQKPALDICGRRCPFSELDDASRSVSRSVEMTTLRTDIWINCYAIPRFQDDLLGAPQMGLWLQRRDQFAKTSAVAAMRATFSPSRKSGSQWRECPGFCSENATFVVAGALIRNLQFCAARWPRLLSMQFCSVRTSRAQNHAVLQFQML